MSKFNSDGSGRTPKKRKRRSNAQNKTFELEGTEEKYYYETSEGEYFVTVYVLHQFREKI